MGNELLIGRFDASIDAKGRVKLPEEWGFAFGPGKLMCGAPFRDGLKYKGTVPIPLS